MKMKNAIFFSWAFFCLLLVNQTFAQTIVQDVNITSEEANIQMTDQTPQNYLVEIAGPDAYYHKQKIENTTDIHLTTEKTNGERFDDGRYTLQITPIYELTEEQRATLITLRQQNDQEAIAKFRTENNLPTDVDQYVVYFSIQNGNFVAPTKEAKMQMPSMSSQWNEDYPGLYASVNPIEADLPSQLIEDKTNLSEDAQVIATDLIVQGSACVGFDCTSSESFGFDTGRYKENNLRVHFDDTSASASFPQNDWRISINDSSNGGSEYFAVQDATANTTPFYIAAGSGNNAIYVSNSGGNVGFGTSSPAVEVVVTDGDSPTMRLEQNGSNGWTPQIWDLAGNETNFFVRDVTNGSKLPFKIKPGAPDNAIFIKADGNIGLGSANPSEKLHVESGDVYVKSGNVGINVDPTVPLDVVGASKLTGDVTITGNATLTGTMSFFSSTVSNFFSLTTFSNMFVLDAPNGYVGIGMTTTNTAPSHVLEVGSDDVVKPNGGDWLGASDRRLKKDIVDFTDGLEKVMQIRPVKFHYNGKLGMSTDREYIGIIAQEVQEVAPYMVRPLNDQTEEGKKEDYLAYDGTAMTYLLVNAVQEQQAIIDAQKEEIDQLQSELAQLQTLKAEVAALAELMKNQNADEAVGEE